MSLDLGSPALGWTPALVWTWSRVSSARHSSGVCRSAELQPWEHRAEGGLSAPHGACCLVRGTRDRVLRVESVAHVSLRASVCLTCSLTGPFAGSLELPVPTFRAGFSGLSVEGCDPWMGKWQLQLLSACRLCRSGFHSLVWLVWGQTPRSLR